MFCVFFIKTTSKTGDRCLFETTAGAPQFLVPMAKMCSNVAPCQCHGLSDYFGAVRSVRLLNLCFGNTVTPSVIRIHQLVKNGPLFQPGSQKQQRCVIPCYEISTTTITLVHILGPGLCCIDRARAVFTAPIICETSRVLWVNVCGVSFSNGCRTATRPTEQADPGISCRSKWNTVKLRRLSSLL